MPLSDDEIGLLEPDRDVPTTDPVMSLDMASRNDPERSAEVFNIASKQDIPTAAVEPHLDEYKRLEQSTAVPAETMGPSVRKLVDNPDTANIVHDDLANLVATEELLGWDENPKGSVKRQLGDIGGHFSDIGDTLYAGIIGTSAAFQGVLETGSDVTGLSSTPFGKYLKGQRQYGQERADELMPQTGNRVANTVYQGLRSSVQNLLVMPAGPGVALPAMATQVFGDSYTRAHDQGMSTPDAITFALTDAITEALTEKIPLEQLFKSVGGADGYLKTLVKQLATEIPTEQMATLVQDLNAWAFLPENAEKNFDDYLSERYEAAFDTLVATVAGTTVTTSTLYGATRAVNAFDERATRKADAVFNEQMREAEVLLHSEKGQQVLDSIITMGQESKINERAQDVYKGFLAGEGSDKSVFLPADILEELEDVPDFLAEQLDGLGGEIEIPMDLFMSEIVHDEALMEQLRPHMKLGADLLSATEIEQGGQMTTRRLLERAQANADIKTESDEIFEGIREQLVATGRMTQAEASKAAQLYPAIAAIQAERYGISPAEVYERMGLTIQGPGGAPAASDSVVMTQAQESGYEGDSAIEATEWNQGVAKYGVEGMTTEARLARAETQGYDTGTTYYHGTDRDFSEFDTMDFGSWFAVDPSTADEYTERHDYLGEESVSRMIPVHLKTENTLRIPKDLDLGGEGTIEQFLEGINAENNTNITPEMLDIPAGLYGDFFEFIGLNHKQNDALQAAGFDSVEAYESGKKTMAIFGPEQVRSVNAAFNEDNVGDANILAQAQNTGYEGDSAIEATEWNQGVAKYGVEGMTTEARMARAETQGYDTDTTWYHGTDKTFEEFDGMTFLTEHQGEASAYANSPEFRANRRRESYLSKVTKGELTPEEFGRVPYTGIVADIDTDGIWATDNGVVRVTGTGRTRTVEYMSNAVDVDGSYDGDTVEIQMGESDSYEQAVADADLGETVESSPQVIPAFIKDGKFKEVGPLEANILGARLRGNLSEEEQAKYQKLLAKIEGWKAEGYIGLATVSDDIGFGAVSEEGAPQQRIMFNPSDIRSTNAAFNEDSVDSSTLLAQTQVDKRRSMVEKLLDCVKNTG